MKTFWVSQEHHYLQYYSSISILISLCGKLLFGRLLMYEKTEGLFSFQVLIRWQDNKIQAVYGEKYDLALGLISFDVKSSYFM